MNWSIKKLESGRLIRSFKYPRCHQGLNKDSIISNDKWGAKRHCKESKGFHPDWLLGGSKKLVSFRWEPSSRLQTANFWLYPHRAERGRESPLRPPLANSSRLHPHPLIFSQRHPPNTITLELGLEPMNWRDTDIQSIALALTFPSSPGSHLSLQPGSLAISPFLWSHSHPSGQIWFLLCSTNNPIGSAPNKLETYKTRLKTKILNYYLKQWK